MNYVKNPNTRATRYPKINDGSKCFSVGVQCHDNETIPLEANVTYHVIFYPGFNSYIAVYRTDDTRELAVSVLEHLILQRKDGKYLTLGDVRPECWRVVSQQLRLSTSDPEAALTWEAMRIDTRSFRTLKMNRYTLSSNGITEVAIPDFYQFINKNDKSYCSGTQYDLHDTFFQANLNHHKWPWLCLCCPVLDDGDDGSILPDIPGFNEPGPPDDPASNRPDYIIPIFIKPTDNNQEPTDPVQLNPDKPQTPALPGPNEPEDPVVTSETGQEGSTKPPALPPVGPIPPVNTDPTTPVEVKPPNNGGGPPPGSVEEELWDLINAYRQSEEGGQRPPLTWNSNLYESAQYQSQHQANIDELTHIDDLNQAVHTDPPRQHRFGYIGSAVENVSPPGLDTAQQIFDGWKNDPPHEVIMVDEGIINAGQPNAATFPTFDGAVAIVDGYATFIAGSYVQKVGTNAVNWVFVPQPTPKLGSYAPPKAFLPFYFKYKPYSFPQVQERPVPTSWLTFYEYHPFEYMYDFCTKYYSTQFESMMLSLFERYIDFEVIEPIFPQAFPRIILNNGLPSNIDNAIHEYIKDFTYPRSKFESYRSHFIYYQLLYLRNTQLPRSSNLLQTNHQQTFPNLSVRFKKKVENLYYNIYMNFDWPENWNALSLILHTYTLDQSTVLAHLGPTIGGEVSHLGSVLTRVLYPNNYWLTKQRYEDFPSGTAPYYTTNMAPFATAMDKFIYEANLLQSGLACIKKVIPEQPYVPGTPEIPYAPAIPEQPYIAAVPEIPYIPASPEVPYQAAIPEQPYVAAVPPRGTPPVPCPDDPVANPTYQSPGYSGESPTRSMDNMIDQATIISQDVPTVTSQDPDGILWIDPSAWTPWDGVTTIDPRTVSKSTLCEWVRGGTNPNTIRGLRERFYEVNPFADNTNPTVAEIENWNLEVIRHVRRLLNVNVPIRYNTRLMLECIWSDERKHTEIWDTKYPGRTDPDNSASDICNAADTSLAQGHCGEAFFPTNITDRNVYTSAAPYLNNTTNYPDLVNYTSRYGQTAGLASVNTNIPWSIKLGRILTAWICGEGYVGHPGPFINPDTAREEVGMSWRIDPNNSASTGFRGKWT